MRTLHLVGGACALWLAACYQGPEGRRADTGVGIDVTAGEEGGGEGGDEGGDEVEPDAPAPARVQLRRLTQAQYLGTLQDLLGSVATPDGLEPDLVVDLYASVGASQATMSQLGAEQFETAATDAASEAFATRASEIVGCDPSAPDCIESFVRDFGQRAFRRPLDEDEVDRYVALSSSLASVHGDPMAGPEGVVAAMLASPSFLYIVEMGEPDPDNDERWRFTSLEMASRISYAVWGSAPDDELLQAGLDGELVDPKAIRQQARRLVGDARTRLGIGRFLSEWLGIDVVTGLTKDAEVYPEANPELFASMQGELTRLVDAVAFDPERSMLELLDTRKTFVDARLATLYGVTAPTDVDGAGFGEVTLPAGDGRRGVLGTAGFLATQARRTRTSPTLRGLFVQQRLLCNNLPPPPPDVPMDIPDGGETADQTLREMLEEHRTNPACASCHALMDPIGIALENYDAIGSFRTEDNGGHAIDASVELEGERLAGIETLAGMLREDPAVANCIVRQLLRFTTGHVEDEDQDPAIDALTVAFEEENWNLVHFLPRLLASSSFRTLAAP